MSLPSNDQARRLLNFFRAQLKGDGNPDDYYV